jgi:hypothetical protein
LIITLLKNVEKRILNYWKWYFDMNINYLDWKLKYLMK